VATPRVTTLVYKERDVEGGNLDIQGIPPSVLKNHVFQYITVIYELQFRLILAWPDRANRSQWPEACDCLRFFPLWTATNRIWTFCCACRWWLLSALFLLPPAVLHCSNIPTALKIIKILFGGSFFSHFCPCCLLFICSTDPWHLCDWSTFDKVIPWLISLFCRYLRFLDLSESISDLLECFWLDCECALSIFSLLIN
jgi:hypothetical protein